MRLKWYIKLNILVIVFLCVIFVMRKWNTVAFQSGLQILLFPKGQVKKRSVRIHHSTIPASYKDK